MTDRHPKDIPILDRRRERAEEHTRTLRDNPPENDRAALEAWRFRWVLRQSGWRHQQTGATVGPDEAARAGEAVLKAQGWVPAPSQWMWVQPDLRMAFLPEDLGAMFPGKDGPYDLWHWLGHHAARTLGIFRCAECGKELGPPETCSACGREKHGGRCPVCSMVRVVGGVP
mgnify:CR=1 FL=1